MKKLLAPVLCLAALAVVLAGCGGGGSSKSSSGGGGSSTSSSGGGSGSGGNGVDIGNCQNENYDFLVQPSEGTVDGMSPAGVSFSLILYKDKAAAQAAYKKKPAKTTATVDNAVIDFHGNPTPYAGAPPAKISKSELANIKSCIETGK